MVHRLLASLVVRPSSLGPGEKLLFVPRDARPGSPVTEHCFPAAPTTKPLRPQPVFVDASSEMLIKVGGSIMPVSAPPGKKKIHFFLVR
jgi:hypothetical protein